VLAWSSGTIADGRGVPAVYGQVVPVSSRGMGRQDRGERLIMKRLIPEVRPASEL